MTDSCCLSGMFTYANVHHWKQRQLTWPEPFDQLPDELPTSRATLSRGQSGQLLISLLYPWHFNQLQSPETGGQPAGHIGMRLINIYKFSSLENCLTMSDGHHGYKSLEFSVWSNISDDGFSVFFFLFLWL